MFLLHVAGTAPVWTRLAGKCVWEAAEVSVKRPCLQTWFSRERWCTSRSSCLCLVINHGGFWIVRRDLGSRQMLSVGRSAAGSFPRMTSVPSEGAWNVVLGQRSLIALGKAGVLEQVGQPIRVHCSGLLYNCLQLLAQDIALQ